MNKEEAIKNLKQYIKEDFTYREPIKNMSDFDRYCYNHCKDIDIVLSELETYKEATDNLRIEIISLKAKNIELKKRLNDSIPKQIIIDKIEELTEKIEKEEDESILIRYNIERNVLQEILKGEKQ